MSDKIKNTSRVKAWVQAARLRTLPLSFSVIILGNALAYLYINQAYHFWQKVFKWDIFIWTLATTLVLQILSNLANDYGDAEKGADNKDRIGPERAIQSGLLSKNEMKMGIIWTSILAVILGTILLIVSFGGEINIVFVGFFLLGVAAIAAAIKYTVGKNAYGYKALGDLFVFIFFGMVGVAGSFFLQTGTIEPLPIYFGASMGAFSTMVLNLNNMRDRQNDQNVGKETLAVKLGFKGSKFYHLGLFILGWLPYFYQFIKFYPLNNKLMLFVSPILLFHIIHMRKVFKISEPKSYDPELKKIALSTFLLSVIFFCVVYFNWL